MGAITGMLIHNNKPFTLDSISYLMKPLLKFPHDNIHTWSTNNVFLGGLSQWITPESIGERLPFYDNQRQLVITADAILDNRGELFSRLGIRVSDRKSITDSQLILLAYFKWGQNCAKYLLGDFAFMIWDENRQIMFGARDFTGSRTLYYSNNSHCFIFSTLIEPLLKTPYIGKELNEYWLSEYLAIPNMIDSFNPAQTVYSNIQQIPPSHTITINKGTLRVLEYSPITDEKEYQNLKTNQDYEEAFRDVFQKSIKARMRTYKEVGSQLSGGLDSGSIVSVAAQELEKENKTLHTYSYVPEADFTDWTPKHRVADERSYIQATVDFVGNIKGNYLDFSGQSSLSVIDEVLETMEMPYKFFENSFWLKGIYEQAKRDNIGILLNGARGNFTISWGSCMDYQAILLRRLKWMRFYKELSAFSQKNNLSKKQVSAHVFKKAFPTLNKFKKSSNNYSLPSIINPVLAERTNVVKKMKSFGIDDSGLTNRDALSIRKEHFNRTFFWNTSMTSTSKFSLRYSLLQRDPTNDIRVIRFCLSLPIEQFVQDGTDRSLIRRSTVNLLPDKVRLNHAVRGIQGADVIHRMSPSWQEFISEVQKINNNPLSQEYLNMGVINKALKNMNSPKTEWAFNPEFRILMRCIVINKFLEKHLERR